MADPTPGRVRRSIAVPREVARRAGLGRFGRVLAGALADDGTWLLGTRDALVRVPLQGEPAVLPWEQVEHADWSKDGARLRITEVGAYGEPRPEHVHAMSDPGLLVDLVRERVTASVVLQRHAVVREGRGLFVIGRRAPRGAGAVHWMFAFDAGLDPTDPAVRAAAQLALAEACAEIGADPAQI
ncbi:MAG: hypothetical protein Q8Q02_00135 [Nocardioides sp.]|nr:hypothetical protein [Nocardioides sp.]